MSHEAAIASAWRAHWARLLALLVRRFRDVDLAEEALQDAFAAAALAWGRDGIPANPAAWLMTTAQRRVLDRLRRRATETAKAHLIREDDMIPPDDPADDAEIADERLALIALCCHPALSPEARVALTLRLVGGLPTPSIARLFFVSEPTMAARLTRAKHKIAAAGIPFRMPTRDELAGRLTGILSVIYLIFTEGYAPTTGSRIVQAELCDEAIRLARLLLDILPHDPEPLALTALMTLHHARRDARADADGAIVLLKDQDRARWHWDEIRMGQALLHRAIAAGQPGSYTLQAAIAAAHVEPHTDWHDIAVLYAMLERIAPSPAIRLNRAIAVAEAEGAQAGLTLLEGLDESFARSSALPTARAELLLRLGRTTEAAAQFDNAIAKAGTDAEHAFLLKRRRSACLLPDDSETLGGD